MKPNELITQAERDIGRILARLEKDTGNVVESIEKIQIETTRMDSDRSQFARRVRIEMYTVPGSDWQ